MPCRYAHRAGDPPRSTLPTLLALALAGCAATTRVRPTPTQSVAARTRAAVPPPAVAPAAAAPAPAPTPAAPAAPPAFADLPGWNDDATAEVLPAWRRTCERLLRTAGTRPVGRDALAGTVADWQPACRALPPPEADHAAVRAYFEQWFVPARVGDGTETGLFTGYYLPELRGSRTRTERFTVPLYRRPADLARRRPYFTRAQIAAGALRRRGQPLVWVDDAVAAFFLEIQGSGRVVLDDGSVVHVHYDGANGHPYVAIGRVMIEMHALERGAVSLQTIRTWLLEHPAQAQAVMNTNPSYVFFRETATEGAHGAEGVVLTAGRSLAVDPRVLPLGVPLFLDVAPLAPDGPIRRLVVAQDTGGAIRGVVRGDLFWGAGPAAYDRAGRMAQPGRYWMLVPRTVTPPVIPASAARRAPEGRSAATSAATCAPQGC